MFTLQIKRTIPEFFMREFDATEIQAFKINQLTKLLMH
jgi:hypothetical protein